MPTEAGGDLLVRALFEGVSARLGKPIVVVNKPGAAGSAGYREIHEAAMAAAAAVHGRVSKMMTGKAYHRRRRADEMRRAFC